MSALTVIVTPPADWTVIVAPIATLAGGLGGYWLAGRNEEARDCRAAKRAAGERRAAFGERLEEDRHHFQRDTLLELQDELLRLARNTALAIAQDQQTLKQSSRFFLLGEPGGTEARQIVASVQRLRSRVLDDQLREQIERYVGLCASEMAIVARFPGGLVPMGQRDAVLTELSRLDREMATAYQRLTDVLGAHIRRELDRRYLLNDSVPDAEQGPLAATSRRPRLRRRGADQ